MRRRLLLPLGGDDHSHCSLFSLFDAGSQYISSRRNHCVLVDELSSGALRNLLVFVLVYTVISPARSRILVDPLFHGNPSQQEQGRSVLVGKLSADLE